MDVFFFFKENKKKENEKQIKTQNKIIKQLMSINKSMGI